MESKTKESKESEIAQGVERYFTENRNYPATLTSISPAPCALCQDDYFNYSLQDVGTSTYTVQALKYNGAARYDLRLDHLGAQSYSTAGTDSWQQGWP